MAGVLAAAAGSAVDVRSVLVHVLVVLVAAKLAAEGAERVGMPAVVGEILAGVVVGPSLLGWVQGDEVLRVLGELGVILLLLEVGLQLDLRELGAVGRAAVSVAVVGIVLPMAGGVAVASALGQDGQTAVFVGAALTATSVGITARVFGDLRALSTVEARTVLGAAVADDVLGLVILTVVVRLVEQGSVSVAGAAGVLALAVAFLLAAGVVGVRAAPRLFAAVQRVSRSPGTLVALALAFCLAFAEAASAARLAPIVGAFVAGLALARSDQAERIRRELTPVGHVFVPVFFLQIGIDTDAGRFADPAVLGLAGALLAVAVVGKVAAGWAAVGAPGDRLLTGLAMVPRGEVGLIFAGIGLRQGVLGDDLYAALLLVVLATTLATPPLVRARLRRVGGARAGARGPVGPMPEGGWVRRDGDVVELAGSPPPSAALPVALHAAVLVADGPVRAGPALLDWFASLPEGGGRWDRATTAQLFDVLRRGNARSWRLLQTTGMLDRALPELAAVVRRRGADPSELDPTRVLSWSLVDGLHEAVDADPAAHAEHEALGHPEWLLLAALILDAAGEGEAPVAAARQLCKRLDLGAAAEQEVALLVGESGLLRAAASRPDGLDEEAVVPLASHLERPERARALFLLSLALGGLDPWERARLAELHQLVQALLGRPDVVGREARNLAEQRRAEATRLAPRPAHDRLARAPRSWLVTAPPEALARQAALAAPAPVAGEVRVAVRPEGDRWRVDVACRDRPGLLAAVTGALAEAGLDVLDAVAATWPDGAALESFRVASGGGPPDPDALRDGVGAALGRPLSAGPVAGATVAFDGDASPWYTLCRVEAPDAPGLLYACALAFAAAGASVHSARVETVGGRATDRFELTDARRGGKLDPAAHEAVRLALEGGAALRRPRPRRARKVATHWKHPGHGQETVVSYGRPEHVPET